MSSRPLGGSEERALSVPSREGGGSTGTEVRGLSWEPRLSGKARAEAEGERCAEEGHLEEFQR